jgi:Tol biopolymer transport system component
LAFYRRFEIWVANADGSEQRRLKGVPETSFQVGGSPVFSPDGRWIAFFHPVAGPSGDLWLIPSSGGKGHQLTFDRREGGFPVWSPDGRWIIYSSGRAGSLTLWRVPVRGGAPEALTTGAGEDSEAAISSDGRRLIFTNVRHTWSLMFLDSVSGSHKELLSKRQPIGAPVFSPAGNRITFFHLIEGDSHLFTTDITGEDTQQVTHGRGQENIMPSWSADESFLYFYRSHPAPSFRKMSTAGADSAQIAPWVWGTQNWAQVDPSGREAVYTLRERNAPKAAIVRNLATGQERALGMAITRAQWSRDGQLLLGSTHDDRVAICPASGGECALVTRGHHARWSADNTRIYFLRSRGNSGWFELWSASRDGSGEKSIALLGPFRSFLVHFDVSKRGHIVWAPFHEGRQELWLTELR